MTEQLLMVPEWRELPAPDFLAWFREHEPRLVAFFAPLQLGSGVLVLAAAVLYGVRRQPGAGHLALATVLVVAALALYPLYFQAVNASFVAGTIPLDAVPDELARWSAWQWVRIAIGVGAFAAALIAVRAPQA